MQWQLRVLHVADRSWPTGSAYLVGDRALLGRSPDASVRIEHATVSRHHLRWTVLPLAGSSTGLVEVAIENLSDHGAVFVDGRPVAPKSTWRGPSPTRLQVGALLFAVTEIPATETFVERIDIGEPAGPETARLALFEIARDGDARAIRCRGRFVDLPPAACRLFARLAEDSAAVVHRWDLQEVVGPGGNLAQLVTTVRQGIRSLIDAGVLDVDELRATIREASGSGRIDDLATLEADALLRRLVLSRRGHGYVLCIPTHRLRFVEVDDDGDDAP